jgi:hypothetical protein
MPLKVGTSAQFDYHSYQHAESNTRGLYSKG